MSADVELVLLKTSTEELLDELETLGFALSSRAIARRDLIRAEVIARLGAQYRAGLEAGRAER